MEFVIQVAILISQAGAGIYLKNKNGKKYK